MPHRLALKRLTASDLTFFQWQFENRNAGNQKAINLNADIFEDILYPNITAIAGEQGNRVPIDLYLYGPGFAGEYNIQRKIVKGETYKNWRLNGEFVYNPVDDPTRYNVLQVDDLAVFSFRGELFPHAASIYFVANDLTQDKDLHRELMQLLSVGRRSMMSITEEQLNEVLQQADVAEAHPLYDLLLEDALQDAAQNGIGGIRRLRTTVSRRRITREALRQARENAGRIGRRGEEFVYQYLTNQVNVGKIASFRWLADENAISPYDFEVTTASEVVFVEVKATEGAFSNPIHISYNELLQMQEARSYQLYRVYEIKDRQARLRIVRDVKAFAEKVLAALKQMPEGVQSDSISVTPDVLSFDRPLRLTLPTVTE